MKRIFALLLFFSLATHASSPPLQKAVKLPKLIDGHFTYVEYVKSDNAQRFVEDEETVKVELTLELLQQDPSGQMAFYRLDNASFRANGKETFAIKSPAIGCVETHIYERTGHGLMESYATNAASRQITPTTLIWFIQEKRFSLTFVSPTEKGKEIHTFSDSCSKEKPAPITSSYSWVLDLQGAVVYIARTKTYRFAFLDTYEVPYRDDPDIKSTVHFQGELTGPMK